MKTFFVTAIVLLFVVSTAYAQNQNIYFYKNNGDTVSTKDSADFIRIVREPEAGSELYNVLDYYPSGKRKLVGKSSSIFPQRFEGPCLEHFESGKRSIISNYSNGRKAGACERYYPNGTLYMHIAYPIDQPFAYGLKDEYITDIYDSTGVAVFKNGNGHYSLYNATFTEVLDDGELKNRKRDGIWTGVDNETQAVFNEEYNNGELTSGIATKNGKTATYFGQRMIQPKFPGPGGENAFNYYLMKHVRYPAEERVKKIQGLVILTFFVEEDGKITGIRVLKGVSIGINNEAIRAIRDSSPWLPGVKHGFPEKVSYSVPIAFAIGEE